MNFLKNHFKLCLKQHAGTHLISGLGTQFAALLGVVSNSLCTARI
ncbi:hypothetical protein BH23THE1_BH23THE1_32950 [soil metagenome]